VGVRVPPSALKKRSGIGCLSAFFFVLLPTAYCLLLFPNS
jgi:hypothetical protein